MQINRSVYKLDVELAAPVAASDPSIHLDSFLSYAAGIEQEGYDTLQHLDKSDDPRYFKREMPLQTYNRGKEWVWACSAARVCQPDDLDKEEGKWNTTRWRKRFDVDNEHQKKETQINVTTGEFKSYNAALPYTPTDRLIFFFEGQPDKVVELIEDHVPAIGKKRSQGFGRIQSIEYSDVTVNMDSAIYHAGKTLRSLPAGFVDGTPTGVRIERRTVRPPYWHAENQCMAYSPFQDVSEHGLQRGVKDV